MQKKHIYLSPPDVGENERKLLLDAFDSNWIAPSSPCVDSFGQQLATRCQSEARTALASGKAPIHSSIKCWAARQKNCFDSILQIIVKSGGSITRIQAFYKENNLDGKSD